MSIIGRITTSLPQGDGVYLVTIQTTEPADSLTMHGDVVLSAMSERPNVCQGCPPYGSHTQGCEEYVPSLGELLGIGEE